MYYSALSNLKSLAIYTKQSSNLPREISIRASGYNISFITFFDLHQKFVSNCSGPKACLKFNECWKHAPLIKALSSSIWLEQEWWQSILSLWQQASFPYDHIIFLLRSCVMTTISTLPLANNLQSFAKP